MVSSQKAPLFALHYTCDRIEDIYWGFIAGSRLNRF